MDERDAKRKGIQIISREMKFVRGYVTCTTCAANYSAASPDKPIFCQTYSRPVDPSETDENILRAEACKHWVAKGMDRNKVVTPTHDYHYEKWDV